MRKSARYLNDLRQDVQTHVDDFEHTVTDLANVTSNLACLPTDDLRFTTVDGKLKEIYNLMAKAKVELKLMNLTIDKYRRFM